MWVTTCMGCNEIHIMYIMTHKYYSVTLSNVFSTVEYWTISIYSGQTLLIWIGCQMELKAYDHC